MANKHSDKQNKWLEIWHKGKLQKFFRVSYDVFWNVLLFFIILGLIGFFFVGGVGAGYFASLVKDEPIRSKAEMEKRIYNYEETTLVYFDNNQYLGKLSSDLYREEINIDDVSEHVISALIATEDEYFFEHPGVVPKAILRALFQEVSNSSIKTGGSTLTQQLIKNQILTNEVSFERKAKEILLALRLEQFFDKEKILEAYLNVVPFGRDSSGRNIAGIQTAAQGIFGVDAADLNLPQAAYIAGLPQSPFYYTPFKNGGELKSEEGLEPGLERMKVVLERMYETGVITKQEYEEALEYDIVSDFAEWQPLPIQQYPFLTFEIEKRARDILTVILAEQDGYTKEDLENNEQLREQYKIIADRDLRQNGYKIHTTIDKEIYDKFQEIAKEYDRFAPTHTIVVTDPETGERQTKELPVQVGSILIENKTGRIIAFVGGRDFSISELNHATDTLRPNGSTMKPLLDYAPAFEKGIIQPGSPIPDVEFTYGGSAEPWSPANYTGREHGLTSARLALARSYNIPAARTYLKMLNERPAEYLKEMGFTSLTEGDMYNASMSIGGLTNGVTVEENVNAYVTFANYGKFVDAYMIERIETKDGELIYEHESEPVEVFSPQTAYLTLDMMRDVLKYGTATYTNYVLNHKNVDWAGKTGTTQNWQDTWFVATNPNVTIGSWMGYDTYDANGDGSADPEIINLKCSSCDLGYSNRNVRFWSMLVNAASEIRPELMIPQERFKNPGGIVRTSICEVSGLLPGEACQELGLVKSEVFNAKYVPKKEDYSLIKGNYVTIDEKVYASGENTPEEFTQEGYFLNPKFLKDMEWDKIEDLNKLIPDREGWEQIKVPEVEELENDEKAPSSPKNVAVENEQLIWEKPKEKDVIGYRIYQTDQEDQPGELIGSTTELEFMIPAQDKAYYVTAVDYFGQESDPSATVIYGELPDNSQCEEENDFGFPFNDTDEEDCTDDGTDTPPDDDHTGNDRDPQTPGDGHSDDGNTDDGNTNDGNTGGGSTPPTDHEDQPGSDTGDNPNPDEDNNQEQPDTGQNEDGEGEDGIPDILDRL
ncbi:MAG: transglycosylase domain-containing protein [Bacillaceae bacterium]|nr:transglycosylase domain-containing protein [Bacillaceae bacterium]